MSTTITASNSTNLEQLVYRLNAKGDNSYNQESENLLLLPSTNYLLSNLTIIRDRTTSSSDLSRAFQRVATQIIAKGKFARGSQKTQDLLIDISSMRFLAS